MGKYGTAGGTRRDRKIGKAVKTASQSDGVAVKKSLSFSEAQLQHDPEKWVPVFMLEQKDRAG
jgi:hypothetical protein